jgi:hypothetical protein
MIETSTSILVRAPPDASPRGVRLCALTQRHDADVSDGNKTEKIDARPANIVNQTSQIPAQQYSSRFLK